MRALKDHKEIIIYIYNHHDTLAEPLCMGGKEFTECGSACPATCENRRSDMVCPQMCVPGCFCPPGTVDNNGTCIDPMHCSDTQGSHFECAVLKEELVLN